MHEEALLRDLRRKLEEIAFRESVARITLVRLRVGALAHTPEATLRSRWDGTVRGTAAEGSALEIETSNDITDPRADRIVLVGVDTADPGDLLKGPRRPPASPAEE